MYRTNVTAAQTEQVTPAIIAALRRAPCLFLFFFRVTRHAKKMPPVDDYR